MSFSNLVIIGNGEWAQKIKSVINSQKNNANALIVPFRSIQDFDFFVEKKDAVHIMDELGFFNWGSQTILLYNPNDFKIENVEINKHHFVGELLSKK